MSDDRQHRRVRRRLCGCNGSAEVLVLDLMPSLAIAAAKRPRRSRSEPERSVPPRFPGRARRIVEHEPLAITTLR
jgi:hypothetical protein